MILYAVFFCVILFYLFVRFKDRKIYELSRQLNNDLLTIPFIGHLYLFVGNAEYQMKTFMYFGRKALKNGGLTAMWLGPKLFTVVADPVTFEYLSKTCLEKDDITYNIGKTLIGNGSIFAPVSIWRPRRKVVALNFGLAKLNSFVDIFSQQSQVMVKNLKKLKGKETISLWNYLSMYSMDSVFGFYGNLDLTTIYMKTILLGFEKILSDIFIESILGVKVCAQKNSIHPFLKAFEENCDIFGKKIMKPYIYETPFYKLTSGYATFVRNNEFVHEFLKKLIKSIRDEHENKKEHLSDSDEQIANQKPHSFLNMMIKTSGGEHSFSDEELLEESLVLVLAGTDTSATGAAFVAMMLSRHPDVQDKVYKELQEVFNDSDRSVTAKDLTQLNYMEAVIKETLRLYPPVPVTIRKVDKDVIIPSGLTLVKGSSLLLHTWAINRNPQYWGQDAEEFKPERFIDGAPLHPAAFAVFSFGPRNCLGYKYALLSMKTAIANLVRNFKILPAEPLDPYVNNGKCLEKEKPLRVKFEIMMRDVDNFRMRLESRVKEC